MTASQIEELIAFAHLMYDRKYAVASEGNLSIRTDRNTVIITPSNLIKKLLTAEDLIEIDMEGNTIRGTRQPSSERFTHLAIYRQNQSARAIVHAHPPYTLIATLSEENPFTRPVLAETAMFLHDAVVLPYARPSSVEGAKRIIDAAHNRTIVIAAHGSFTHGKNLSEAFSLLEILEKCAMIDYLIKCSGQKTVPLSADEIQAIRNIPYGT
ncbi:MAG TPA: class II aldolase/adducin family protein [Spirochaetota bacterium]